MVSRVNGIFEDAVAEGVVGLADIVTVVADVIPVAVRTGDDEPSFFDLVPTTAPPTAAATIANKIAPIRHVNLNSSRIPAACDYLAHCLNV